jgi:HlyD family secretion protein
MKLTKTSLLTITGLMFLVVALGLSAGCNRQASSEKDANQNKESPKHTPAAPGSALVQMTFTHKIESPGEIQADEQTKIFAKISGYVKKVNKDVGHRVEADDILAELSVPELDEELSEKKARVKQADAEWERAKKLHAAAEANVNVADAKWKEAIAARPRAAAELARAKLTFERMKEIKSLVAPEAIADTELGFEASKAAIAEVEARIKSAEAWHFKSVAEKDTANTDIKVAEARLRVAEAAARNVEETVKYAKLTAPYKGVVIKRNVDLGDLIKSSKEEPAFIVARMDPVRIFVDVPENDAVLIKDEDEEKKEKDVEKKTKVVVRVQAIKGEHFQGVVKRSPWAVDPKGGILRTQIDLPNPDGKLRPGMYAYASITVVHKNVWAVPLSAIVTKDDQSYVYLEENGKARRTAVLVGFRDAKFIEVVKKQKHGPEGGWLDFTRDDEVITENVSTLVDGQAVQAGHKK